MITKLQIIGLLLLSVLSLFAEIEISPISHFAKAQHYGQDAITISDSLLITKTKTGIELYQISSSYHLELIHHIDIPEIAAMKFHNGYIYAVTFSFLQEDQTLRRLYQINITVPSNPIIENQIDYDYLPAVPSFDIFNNNQLIVFERIDLGNNQLSLYNLPEMNLIYSATEAYSYKKILNDTIAYYYDVLGDNPTNNLIVNNISNPAQIDSICTVDVIQYHGFWNRPTKFKTYNDTVLIASSNTCITLWNTSDITNWQYINTIQFTGDFNDFNDSSIQVYCEYLVCFDDFELKLYDISDLSNITLSASADVPFSVYSSLYSFYLDMFNNNIYVTGGKDGIHHYEVAGNSLNYLDTFLEFPVFKQIESFESTLIAKSPDYGIYIFDISDPEYPVYTNTSFYYEHVISLYQRNDKCAVSYYEDGEYCFDLYNVSDPYSVNLIIQYQLETYEAIIDANEDWSEIIISTIYGSPYIKKYILNQNGDVNAVYSLDLPNNIMRIDGNLGYLVYRSGINYSLNVYDDIYSNYPELINTIEIPNCSPDNLFLYLQHNYLTFLEYSQDNVQVEHTFFYSRDDLLIPQFHSSLAIPSRGSGLVYQNHYLSFNRTPLVGGLRTSNIYDLTNPGEMINPIDQLHSKVNMLQMKNAIINNQDYIIVCNQGSIEIWEPNYTQSTNYDLIPLISNLSNYPNPFNPTTTISFSLPNAGKTDLSIYNIKGQKIKTLLQKDLEIGEHNIIWDGTNDFGKKTSSGVYFYKLISNGKLIDTNKMLLIK